MALLISGHWLPIRDGDARARVIVRRHYSARHYADNRRHDLFCGPGEKMVLMTITCDALFGWRKFLDDAQPPQTGVNCFIFRNEGPLLSSDLIREACELAWARWPGERLYTYVDSQKIRSSNPGYCYLMAGWTRCSYRTKTDKVVLELTY